MKRYLFALFLGLALAFASKSEYQRETLLEDGKSWVYVKRHVATGDISYRTSEVCGDTIIDNTLFKRIKISVTGNNSMEYHTALREYDGKIFTTANILYGHVFEKTDTITFLDFNVHSGEELTCRPFDGLSEDDTKLLVDKEDTITVCGLSHRRIAIRTADGGFAGYWVEGIGSSGPLLTSLLSSGTVTTFYECRMGDECIFTSEDFDKDIDSLTPPAASEMRVDNDIFDLQGRRIRRQSPGHIYITRSGKSICK